MRLERTERRDFMDILWILLLIVQIIIVVWLTLVLVAAFISAKKADEEAERIFMEMIREIEGQKNKEEGEDNDG